MADGDLIEVGIPGSIDLVRGIAMGNLIDIPDDWVLDLVPMTEYKNRFPTPPSAWGFLVDVDAQFAFGKLRSIDMGGQYTSGILAAGSDLLEPTQGQIWPR